MSERRESKIACRIRNLCNNLDWLLQRYLKDLLRGKLIGTASGLEGFRRREDQFVFERSADHLDTDREAFVRKAERDGGAGEPGQVEPLGIAHGVAVAGTGMIVSLAVAERGSCGNRGGQNPCVLHLAQDFGAEKIAIRAGFHELIKCDGIS